MRMTSITTAQIAGSVSEISFCAWISQAEGGEALVYHQGFLAIDVDPLVSQLNAEQRDVLCALAGVAFRAAAQGLVHLVQERIGPNQFAYVAIARPKPKPSRSGAITRLLEAA